MTYSPELEQAMATLREANELVAAVKQSHGDDQDALRALGLDPAKLDQAALSDTARRELEDTLRRDLEDAGAAAREVAPDPVAQPRATPRRQRNLV